MGASVALSAVFSHLCTVRCSNGGYFHVVATLQHDISSGVLQSTCLKTPALSHAASPSSTPSFFCIFVCM